MFANYRLRRRRRATQGDLQQAKRQIGQPDVQLFTRPHGVNRSVGFVVSGRISAAGGQELQSTALAVFMQLLLMEPARMTSYQHLRNFFSESCGREAQ
jgi:hypothetical protein